MIPYAAVTVIAVVAVGMLVRTVALIVMDGTTIAGGGPACCSRWP